MSNGKLTGTEFRNEFLKSLNILAPRIQAALELYGEDTVDVVNFTSSGTATLNNVSITGLTDIVSDATTEDVLDITADSLTTANVIDISADALTTGTILNLVSDSSDTNARSLVTIKNDNTAATATTLLHLINDSTSASADMIIESTDADAAAAPKMHFLRNSASPAVDDVLGKLLFSGKDDAGNTTLYASMRAEINDETDSGGQEDGVIVFDVIKNSSQKSALELKNNEAVFNNGGADIDFRIESDDETHMLFIEGSTNRMSIGDSTDGPAGTLEVTNHASAGATGAPLVQLNSNDVDQIALDINAANTTADVVDITADAVTTANVIDITADALTSGFAVNIVSDSSDNSSRTLLKVLNDNSSATGTSAASFETHAVQTCVSIHNDNTETDFGPILTVNRKSSTVADDMGAGLINFQGLTDGGTSTGFARISAEASDVTDATPQGKLVLRAQLNIDASEPNAVEELMSLGGGVGADGAGASVVINDLSYDVDFRVESNDETHMLFVDGGNNRISIGDSVDAPAATLEITNHASAGATGVPLLQLNSNDVDKIALDIDAANTTADVIDIAADAVTTAHVMDVTADGLTTGGILNLVSDSSDTSARTLVTVKNDNTAAVGVQMVHFINDAIGGDGDPILLVESTAAETEALVELRNSNAATDKPPILKFNRSDATAEADGMDIGRIRFNATNSASEEEIFASIRAEAMDVTNGAEDGRLSFRVHSGASGQNRNMLSLEGGVGAVFNEDSGSALDFRVESNTDTHFLFIDASTDRMSIGASTDDPAALLEVTNASADAETLVQLNNNDTDQILLDINAANIDADVIDITADAVTTAFVMDVTADALTTGGILNLVSDSSDTSARTLVTVKNDNTAAVGTVVMHLVNDAIGGFDDPILLIESTADETHPVLELKNSNASTTGEPIMIFTRSDTSAEADDMSLGTLIFRGVDADNNNEYYAQIKAFASDVTTGDEGGLMTFVVKAGGTAGTAANKNLFAIGGEDVANTVVPSVVVNEDGINCDFRVESDAEDEAIFLDASAETLYINKGESAFTTQIHSTNDVAMTVSAAGVIFNEDGHATNDFRVESDNNTHMLFVDAGDDTVAAGGIDATNHKDGFAVFNDFNGTTFENTLADGHFGSAEVLRYSPGADDTLAAGQLFFLHTDGTWDSTDADAVATGATQMLGIGLGGSARTVGCVTRGYIRIPSTEILNLPGSGAVDGLPLYVSTTAGHLDFTAPSGNNDFVRVVGYAIDDDSSDVLVYFNPDATHVEITA